MQAVGARTPVAPLTAPMHFGRALKMNSLKMNGLTDAFGAGIITSCSKKCFSTSHLPIEAAHSFSRHECRVKYLVGLPIMQVSKLIEFPSGASRNGMGLYD